MCVKRRFHAAPMKKPDRQPLWPPIGHSDFIREIALQLSALFFGGWPTRSVTGTVAITFSGRAIAVSRWTSTFSSASTLTRSTTLTTTCASESFEHLLQFVAIQRSVLVRVASVEHSLHSLRHFFTAEFAVFVFVKTHDSVEELVRVSRTSTFSSATTTSAFSTSASFTVTSWWWAIAAATFATSTAEFRS